MPAQSRRHGGDTRGCSDGGRDARCPGSSARRRDHAAGAPRRARGDDGNGRARLTGAARAGDAATARPATPLTLRLNVIVVRGMRRSAMNKNELLATIRAERARWDESLAGWMSGA